MEPNPNPSPSPTPNQVRLAVQDKEMEQAQLQNELARLKVDTLNTISHNSQLVAQLKASNADKTPP